MTLKPAGAHSGFFPNPFFDLASTFYPRDIKKTFGWCEYIYITNPIVRSAIERIAQYFITEITCKSEETENTEQLLKWFKKRVLFFLQASIDSMIYGNQVTVIYFPFKRMLVCPKCRFEYAAEENYKFTSFKFVSSCNNCGYEGEFNIKDHYNKNIDEINFLRIDVKDIQINFDVFSGKSEYYWDIPKRIIDQITNNNVPNYLVLNSIPKNILDAISKQKKFKFDKNIIFHMKRPSIAGVSQQWGFPILLSVMKLHYYNAILRRANEAISLDFIVPFRVMSPGSDSSGSPLDKMSSKIFVSQMQQMIYQHRVDHAAIKISPTPVNYQAFGAEKKALDVTPEITANTNEILDGLNCPAELYRLNLQYQAMPGALRMFENIWSYLVVGLNAQLQWLSDRTCDYMGWDRELFEFTKVSVADDMEKKQVFMQLGSAQQISMATALKPFGIDYLDEQKKISYQQKAMGEIQREFQKEMMEEQQLGGEQGGSPAGGMPSDPGSMVTSAMGIAQDALAMPYEQRRSFLHDIKTKSQTLHALVLQKMKEIRGQARTDQGAQAMAQAGMDGFMQNGQQMG